jgi:hypothetical protein
MTDTKNVFETLSQINVNEHTEKKGKFTYLSWAWAWATLKKHYPASTFEKHQFQRSHQQGMGISPYMLDESGYAYVQASVTVEGMTLSETFPVLNNKNKPIQNPSSFDVNTALQRCLVKAIAYHGLGLYIYAGEDIPTDGSSDDSAELKELQRLCKQRGRDYASALSWMSLNSKTVTEAIASFEAKS